MPSNQINVCALVDSNLKNLRFGVQLQGQASNTSSPYLKCAGQIHCVYTVNSRDWPSIGLIQARRYTDIVIALGINHCREHSGRFQEQAVSTLVDLYRHYKAELPDVRLYYVQVPPSLTMSISRKAADFNRAVSADLRSLGVAIVEVPEVLFAQNGTLNPRYARVSELAPSFPDDKRLHLNEDGQRLVVFKIQRTLCRTANIRMR